MKIYILVLLLAIPASSAADATSMRLSSNIQIDVVTSLTTRELWNSSEPKIVESKFAVVDFRMFDSEASPQNNEWRGCGIAMIGTSDLGIRPVTVRIWTRGSSCELQVNKLESSTPQGGAEFNMRICSNEILKIRVTSDLKVSIDGKFVGRIED